MRRGQAITHAGHRIQHHYFVNHGVVSLMKTMRDGRTVEIVAVGAEGMLMPGLVFELFETMALDGIVQVPGTAFRIRRCIFRREMESDRTLHQVMRRYLDFTAHQVVQTVACNCLHSLEERLCRWLIIAHDSTMSDHFPITHEGLALSLGVQRAGISLTAKLLQKAGLISYRRGMVTIANRIAIEARACECYDTLRDRMADMFDCRYPVSTAAPSESRSADTMMLCSEPNRPTREPMQRFNTPRPYRQAIPPSREACRPGGEEQ